jgi:hypothetical protein
MDELRGSIQKLNQVPFDKFKQENLLRAIEFTHLVDQLPTDTIPTPSLAACGIELDSPLFGGVA